MRRAPTAKLRAYLLLAAVGMIAAIALGYPEFAAIGAPFASYVAVGVALDRRPQIEFSSRGWPDRVLERDECTGTVLVRSSSAVERLEIELECGAGLSPVGAPHGRVIRLEPEHEREVALQFRPERWGAIALGSVSHSARDRFGLIDYRAPPLPLRAIKVFPRGEALRALIDPIAEQATTGSRVSRQRGEGIEFADIRPFLPGDRIRRVNWRVAARRGTPYVTERHPERNADVTLLLDTFFEVGDGRGGTLELAVRAASSLAAAYLARRDQVGVVGFGGTMTGLGPRFGQAQLYRILDVLIGSEVIFSYAAKDVRFVPPRMLPPGALVIAISPLVDDRFVAAVVDLRLRGFDLAVLDISPVPFTQPGRTASQALAYRLWLLRRAAVASRLAELGVPVTEWRGDEPLQVPIVSASAMRRQRRRVAA